MLRLGRRVQAAFALIQLGFSKVREAIPLVCVGVAFVCATFAFVGGRVAGIGHLSTLVGVAVCVRRRTAHGVNVTTEPGALRVGEAETSIGRVPSYHRREVADAFAVAALLCGGLSLRCGLATPFGVPLAATDGHVDEIVAVLARVHGLSVGASYSGGPLWNQPIRPIFDLTVAQICPGKPGYPGAVQRRVAGIPSGDSRLRVAHVCRP